MGLTLGIASGALASVPLRQLANAGERVRQPRETSREGGQQALGDLVQGGAPIRELQNEPVDPSLLVQGGHVAGIPSAQAGGRQRRTEKVRLSKLGLDPPGIAPLENGGLPTPHVVAPEKVGA